MPANGENLNHGVLRETVHLLCHIIGRMSFGAITLIIQDGRMIQIDVTEKIRCQNGIPDLPDNMDKIFGENALKVLVDKSLARLKFGQVTLFIQDGRVAQIERVAKQRLRPQQGMDGEGI